MNSEKKSIHIGLTGTTGFVGRHVAREMVRSGFAVTAFVRRIPDARIPGVLYVMTGDYTRVQDWAPYLQGVDVIVHLAALAHQVTGDAAEAEYRQVNIDVTQALLQGARSAAVQQFIFMSSIKVLGEETPENAPFSLQSIPNPQDAYGRTKYAAEQLVEKSGLRYTILRAPLIYGAEAKGNIALLQKLIRLRIPLPLASVHNQRSILTLEDLSQFILQCIGNSSANSQIHLISSQDVSTPGLIRMLAADLNMEPRLFTFPPALLKCACIAAGKRALYQKLCGNLQVQASK